MITALEPRMNTLDREHVADLQAKLADAGVTTIIGTTVNAAGMVLGKSAPIGRLDAFHRSGLGSAPAWQAFCIDAGIAATETISAVGDLRLRLDAEAVRDLGEGLAWGPVDVYTQDGEPSAWCARSLLRRIGGRLAASGLQAKVGHELEFVLVAPDGTAAQGGRWVPYGPSGLLDRERFLADLSAAFEVAGLGAEQLHAEYSANQFEFSLPPRPPVEAADAAVLAKLLVGRVARKHDLRASFSPAPFPGTVGNGAHQHFSLTRDGETLFAGGDGPYGLTSEGASAIAGVIDGLPAIQGLLTSSILSGGRLVPGMWSGAHACWGLENREAAVRFLQGGASNPHGANFEVKVIDPSANVYGASAAVLAIAHEGIANHATLPSEVDTDPSRMTAEQLAEAGIRILPGAVEEIVTALERSDRARSLLTPDFVDATVAVRRYEQITYAEKTPEELADEFRLAWSV
jgi:glutamine synthetase